MKQTLALWAERIDARSLRERLLIFAAAALAVSMLFVTLAFDPLTAKRKALLATLQEHEARMEAVRLQVQTLVKETSRDPDALLKQRLAELRQQALAAQTRLDALAKTLVDAEKMGEVLRDLLAQHRNVRLIALKSLPPVGIGADGKAVSGDASPLVYRQGVEITVEGTFPDLLAYVEAIEASPWRLLWARTRLTVEEYPRSRLTLTLFTLSRDKPWLTV
jgi:MSHA biogenesis protein MshJ